MRGLLSADWHLKLGNKGVPESWALNRYRIMFSELARIERENSVDFHIIMGDLFDKLPNMKELELYFEYICSVQIKTYIIPGNHEMLGKTTTFLTNLVEVTKRLNPLVEIIDDFTTIENIDFIPYNCLKKEWIKTSGEILISHFRGEIPPHVKPEIDLDLVKDWKIVFAGDLHSHSNSQRNIVYPGSPVTTSFHRSLTTTGAILVDTNTLEWEWVAIEVPQLLRKTIKPGDPMPAGDYHHIVYEVEGDMSDMHLVENSELLDKVITKRSDDVALVLTPEMTLLDELTEYLLYILELSDEAVKEVITEYKNIVKEE